VCQSRELDDLVEAQLAAGGGPLGRRSAAWCGSCLSSIKGLHLVRDRHMGVQIGSPARLSRWVKTAATGPRTLTCGMPGGPVRVNRACFSMNANASLTAA
jgi:hypothetical protein